MLAFLKKHTLKKLEKENECCQIKQEEYLQNRNDKEIIMLTSKHVHKITSTIKKCEEFCL